MGSNGQLSSEDLAALIADALLAAGLLRRDEFEHAVEVIAQEIDARKDAGEY